MHEFRELMQQAIKPHLKGGKVALLFSGGTDSLTVLWSLLDLGVQVKCYTFRLQNVVSRDSKVAAIAAAEWGVELEEVVIPVQNNVEIAVDVARLVNEICSARKTHVECLWPFTWLFPRITEEQVWTGLNADDLYGSSKSMAIKYAKDPKGFNLARRKKMRDPTASGWKFFRDLLKWRDKELVAPYRDRGVVEYLMQYNWQQLNRPRQKMPATVAYRDEFARKPIWRMNDNLQCGSGIREYLQQMTDVPVVKLYKAMLQDTPWPKLN